MIDMAIYLAVMGIAFVRLARFLPSYFQQPMRQEALAFIGFGLHLGNYFWSAVAKAALEPYPWTWALENLTYNSTLFSIQNGTLPIGHLPWLVNLVHEVQQSTNTPLNISIICFQFLALIAVLKRSWLKIVTLYYDLLHIEIWIFSGLFFGHGCGIILRCCWPCASRQLRFLWGPRRPACSSSCWEIRLGPSKNPRGSVGMTWPTHVKSTLRRSHRGGTYEFLSPFFLLSRYPFPLGTWMLLSIRDNLHT